MVSLTKVVSSITMAFMLLALLSAVPTVAAQITETGEVGNSTVIRAKAVALQYMLNNSLRLNFNLSEQLRAQIMSLLSVNISELTPQELWDFVRNANTIMVEVCERAKNAVGRDLEAYAHGIAVAIEARVRNIARHYNVSEDEVNEVLDNITQSKSMKDVFRALERLQKTFAEKHCYKFANALAKYLSDETAEAIVKGDAQRLEKAYGALDRVQEALNKTLARLKIANASSTAIEALEEALEHIEIVKEIINGLKEYLPKPEPATIRESMKNVLEELTLKAKEEAVELVNNLEKLMELARKLNATELVEELAKLKEELNSIIAKLESAESVKDVHQILRELAILRARITAMTKVLTNIIEKLLKVFEVWISRLEDQAKKMRDNIRELMDKFEKTKGMMPGKVKERLENLFSVTSSLSSTAASKLEEVKSKLKVRDLEGALTISKEIEGFLVKIRENVEEIGESLKT